MRDLSTNIRLRWSRACLHAESSQAVCPPRQNVRGLAVMQSLTQLRKVGPRARSRRGVQPTEAVLTRCGGPLAFVILAGIVIAVLSERHGRAQTALPPQTIRTGSFTLTYDSKGVTGISNPNDPYRAEVLAPNRRLGDPIVKYKTGESQWSDLAASERKLDANPRNGVLVYSDYVESSPLKMVQTFRT